MKFTYDRFADGTSNQTPIPVAGHFAPVRETALKHALCDWCYRHALAMARAADRKGDITPDDWPPAKACDKLHRVSAQAAGKWLADHLRAAS